jgi:hypothetical protein
LKEFCEKKHAETVEIEQKLGICFDYKSIRKEQKRAEK